MYNISEKTSRVYIYLNIVFLYMKQEKNTSTIINTENKIRKQKKNGQKAGLLNIS